MDYTPDVEFRTTRHVSAAAEKANWLPADAEIREAEIWLNAQIARVQSSGKFAAFTDITVARAKVLLACNSGNRPIIASGVRDWAEAYKRGDWEVNGEPIIVSDTGELNDGQHRLAAIIQSGIAVHTLVVFGVTRASRLTVDTGRKRTTGHILGMRDVPQASLVAASLRVLINLETGGYVNSHRTAKEVERAFDANPDLRLSLTIGLKVARQFHQSGGLFVSLHYLMAKKSRTDADAFFAMLGDGTAPHAKHPVAALRSRLTDNLAAKAKLPIHDVAALIIKSWIAFREGRSVGQLRWRTGGDSPEAFPKVI